MLNVGAEGIVEHGLVVATTFRLRFRSEVLDDLPVQPNGDPHLLY